ncbi:MAG: flavodoxin family protein, partial [Firmicutes bacterium]|nr:flavodoxin family protein [Bacillota bacterium]
IGERAVNGNVDALVNEAVDAVNSADAVIVGTPVYYASPSGEVIAFLDRLFMSAKANFRLKPAAAIASARRAGTTASIDMLLKYFEIKEMPVVSSRYWPMVHGNSPEDVLKDEEGVQIMEVLGRNMAWLLKSIEAGKAAGIPTPEPVKQIKTNFIK